MVEKKRSRKLLKSFQKDDHKNLLLKCNQLNGA